MWFRKIILAGRSSQPLFLARRGVRIINVFFAEQFLKMKLACWLTAIILFLPENNVKKLLLLSLWLRSFSPRFINSRCSYLCVDVAERKQLIRDPLTLTLLLPPVRAVGQAAKRCSTAANQRAAARSREGENQGGITGGPTPSPPCF